MEDIEFYLSKCYACLMEKDPFAKDDDSKITVYTNHIIYDFFDIINFIRELSPTEISKYKNLIITIVVPELREIFLENSIIKNKIKRENIGQLKIEEIATSSDNSNVQFILDNWTKYDVLVAPLSSILKKLNKNESLQFSVADKKVNLYYNENDFYHNY